jgi:hypothetical protein
MHRAWIGVSSGVWTTGSSLLQRAAISSALPRPALAQRARSVSPAPVPLPAIVIPPKEHKPAPKSRSKSPKSKRTMPPPPPSSTPAARPLQQTTTPATGNQPRSRFPLPSNRRGQGKSANRRGGQPTQAALPEQLEGGLHDLNYVRSTYGKDGSVVLKQKYLDTPKAHVQDYMKWVYAKPLEASYHDGYIGRTKMFRQANHFVVYT